MKCVLISRPQLKGGKRRKGRMKDPTEVASQLIKIQVSYSNQLFFFFQRKLGIKGVDKDVSSQGLSHKGSHGDSLILINLIKTKFSFSFLVSFERKLFVAL